MFGVVWGCRGYIKATRVIPGLLRLGLSKPSETGLLPCAGQRLAKIPLGAGRGPGRLVRRVAGSAGPLPACLPTADELAVFSAAVPAGLVLS
jgi:hypothetical protein